MRRRSLTGGGGPSGSGPFGRPTRWHARWETRLLIVALGVAVLVVGGILVSQGSPNENDGQVLVQPASPGTVAPAATADTAAGTAAGTAAPPAGTSTAGIPSATATTDADASATAPPADTPGPTPTPSPVLIDLRPQIVGNGETLLVWVHAPGASSGALHILGSSFPLLPGADGSGIFWTVVGVPVDAPVGTATLEVELRDAEGGTLELAFAEYEVAALERPVDYLVLTEEEASVLTPEAGALERKLRASQFAQADGPARWSSFFQLPTVGIVTTEFGQGRSYNGGPVGSFHTGTDYAAAEGTPVVAASAGRVAWVGEMPIRGLSIVIDHGAGVKSGYHHLSETDVQLDQQVVQGERIGAVGASGLATGPHLHWEVTIWGVNVDPVSWTVKDFTP